MAVIATQSEHETGRVQRFNRIDTDTHNYVHEQHLKPYLPKRWQRYIEMVGLRQMSVGGMTIGAHPMAARTDAWGPNGELPGTDPAFFCKQLLDEHHIDLAVLNSTQQQSAMIMGPGSPRELLAALARAGNEHEQEVWLDGDPRLRGAICVAFEDPDATVAEIERCAADQRFVQILLPFRTIDPLGNKKYWPMLEAAEHFGLPVSLHPAAQHVVTGAGFQSFYYEHHTALPSALYPQMASLIFEGVFDRFPKLQILFQEGAWSWVAPFMWRLDRTWRQLKDEVPDLQRAPSDYVREHFWFTTQPIEEPDRPDQFPQVWDQFKKAGMRSKLMFASDYPHWDFDAPDVAIPSTLSEEDRDSIFRRNALQCYGRLRAEAEAAGEAV